MNLSRPVKWIVAVAAGIGAVLGAAHSLGDIVHRLDGWHVLYVISLLVLAVLGIDFCRQWAERQIDETKVNIEARFNRIVSDIYQRLSKEDELRIAGEQTHRARMDELERGVSALEKRSKTSASAE